MTRSTQILLALLGVLVIAGLGWYFTLRPVTQSPENSEATPGAVQSLMSLEQAISAANSSLCSKEGTVGRTGVYNENSKTWWIDFTPSAQNYRANCNPACVVSETSGTAEINWRCTGAIPPSKG